MAAHADAHDGDFGDAGVVQEIFGSSAAFTVIGASRVFFNRLRAP